MAARMSRVFKAKSKDLEDLSAGFERRWTTSDHLLVRFGLPGDILALSFDQVQSLLAIATTKAIHVLGQNGVMARYHIAAGREVAFLHLHRSHLIAIDTKNVLYAWSIEDKITDPAITQPLRGLVTASYVDPSVDWLFLGMKDGSVLAWDIEGEQINASFKIKNQYFDRQEDWRLMGEEFAVPRYHISPVLQLCLHPVDLGMLLIVYADGACLYSLKDGTAKTYYECIFPSGIRSGNQKPPVTCATFSPDGLFVIIGCSDGTLAFFDANDGEVSLQTRTLEQSDINLTKQVMSENESLSPIASIQWCCRTAPNDTFLLVAGGLPADINGLTILDYGATTPKSQELSEFFASPQRHRILPISRARATALLPLGTASPFYLAHDPRCVLILTSDHHVIALEIPDGRPVSSEILPPQLSISSPRISGFTIGRLPPHVVSHLSARIQHGSRERTLVTGGALREAPEQLGRPGTVLCTIHEGTLLRIFDIARNNLSMPPIAEIDTTLTMPNTFVTNVVISDDTGEIAIASESGLVVIHRAASVSTSDAQLQEAMLDLSLVEPMPTPVSDAKDMLFKFSEARSARSTFDPLCVISARRGQVTTLCVSAVGFVAVGYDSGFFMLVDLRGPAIFYAVTCDALEIKKKEWGLKKPTTPKLPSKGSEYVTAATFLAMNVENRISLVAAIGTNQGRIIYLELLKDGRGIYTAVTHQITTISSGSAVRHVYACNQLGEDLAADGVRLASINMDAEVPECVLVVADEEIVSYSTINTKIANTSFRGEGNTVAAKIITVPNTSIVVLAVARNSDTVEIFSIPNLQALGSSSLHGLSDKNVTLADNGTIVRQDDTHSLSLFNLFGHGKKWDALAQDDLFDALKQPSIPRPTISNWAWVTGTQWVKPADLDQIITGGNRPLSKRALERIAASEKQQILLERRAASKDKAVSRTVSQNARQSGGNDRITGRNAYGEMQQHGQERGERISQVNDVFDNISKASGEWLTEIDKMTSTAKKSAGKAALKSFLGF